MKKHFIAFAIMACALSGLLVLTGCQKKEAEDIVTRGEWLTMLSESFGLNSSNNGSPYYSDIHAGHKLFSAVQALGDWNITAPFSEKALDADKPVTRDEVAASAAIAAGFKPGQEFQMDAALRFAEKYGIARLGGEETMSTVECERVLQAAQQVYLDAPGEEKKVAVLSEDLVDLTAIPSDAMQTDGDTLLLPGRFAGEIYQEETEVKRITVITDDGDIDLVPGDTFVTEGAFGDPWGIAYKVTSMTRDDEGNVIIQTQPPELGDIYDDLEIHTTVSLDQGSIRWAEGVTAEPVDNARGLSATGSEYGVKLLGSTKNDAWGAQLSSTNSFEKTWKIKLGTEAIKAPKIVDSIQNSDVARLLESSGFILSGEVGLEDFADGIQSWHKALESSSPFSAGLSVTGTISIELEVTTDVEYHKLSIFGNEINTWPEEASLIVYPKISSDLTIEGTLEGEFPISEIEIPIATTGLSVKGTLFLYMDINGRLQVGVDMSTQQRVQWSTSAGFRKNEEQQNTFSAGAKEAALEASFGSGVSVDLCVFSVRIIGLNVKFGCEVACAASVIGECRETKADELTVREYTAALHFYSDAYSLIVSLGAKGPEHISDAFGLEASWDIVGRDKAECYHLWDMEKVFWSETVILDEDGNIVSRGNGSVADNTYTTRLASPNVFAFDYPDGWTITEESLSDEAENVVLSNETGAKIYFSFMTYDYAYAPLALNTRVEADISKVADASFDPEAGGEYHHEEGPYMVAKVTTLQEKHISYADGTETVYPRESPYKSYDYAVLPESYVGLDWHGYYNAHYSFDCGGIVQFRAGSAENLSSQEEREVINILASFRIAVTDPLLADLRSGDFTYFAGSYTVDEDVANEYSWYDRDITDWILYSNGESDGGWFLEECTGAKPIRVTLNEDGSYECVVQEDKHGLTEELDYMIVREKFTLYPPGVPISADVPISPASRTNSDSSTIRVVVHVAYGGAMDYLYYKN